jgi:restriction endonuclease S subunit
VERSANGTEAKNVTQETLRAAPFLIPELNEQQRVVAGLNQFSNALKAARANATQLNALRVALVNTFMA